MLPGSLRCISMLVTFDLIPFYIYIYIYINISVCMQVLGQERAGWALGLDWGYISP